MCRLLTLATLIFLCAVSTAFAQFETAALVGTVTDGSGGVVAEALITATNTDTGVTLTRRTDANGHYEFVTLRIGNYLVTAEKAGFALALAENIRLEVGARLRVDLGLQVGQLTERIEVSAVATLLETDTSQRGQVITGEQTRALPLNGREYSSLALLTTGVRLSALNTGGFTPREGSFNVNGLRSTFNNFMIDGVDNNAYGTSNQGFSNQVMQPSPDAVGEFKVVTNNMSAEYGRSAGATINVAYASGTNRVRGSAWEFMRDTVAQRDRVLQAGQRREAAARAASVRRRRSAARSCATGRSSSPTSSASTRCAGWPPARRSPRWRSGRAS